MARKKIEKVSVNASEKVVKFALESELVDTKWNDIDVKIKKTISLREMLMFVKSVVSSCFDDDTGEYLPWMKDFAIRKCIVEMYANFRLPSDVEKQYDFLYATDAVDFVANSVNTNQLQTIIESASEKIEHVASANINDATTRINEALSAIESFGKQMEAITNGVSSDDIKNIVGAISNGKIDEEKVVNAILSRK